MHVGRYFTQENKIKYRYLLLSLNMIIDKNDKIGRRTYDIK